MDLYGHEWLLDRKCLGYLNQLSPEDETGLAISTNDQL